MTQILLVMFTGLLAQVSLSAQSLYTVFYNRPNVYIPPGSNSQYHLQYVIVNSPYGNFIRVMPVPVTSPTTTTTTTTTTSTTTTTTPPPPPPPAEMLPSTFFSYANFLPMQLYSNYICGVFSRPKHFSIGKRDGEQPTNSTQQRIPEGVTWLEDTQNSEAHDVDKDINSVERNNKGSKGQKRNAATRAEAPHVLPIQDVGITLRQRLLRGYSPDKLADLKSVLARSFSIGEIEVLFQVIYARKIHLAQEGATAVKLFYVSDEESTASQLAPSDQKRLLIDLIVIANGRGECSDGCDVDFYSAREISEALSRELLPDGMTQEQIQKAVEATIFLSEANVSESDVSSMFQKFVDDVVGSNTNGPETNDRGLIISNIDNEGNDSDDDSNSEDDNGSEDEDGDSNGSPYTSFYSLILRKLGRIKRSSFYYQPPFDKQIACFVLRNYMASSSYCGVRTSASLVYDNLQCSNTANPLPPVVTTASTRRPESTSTTTTTTTTTQKPTTTTTLRPTTRPTVTPRRAVTTTTKATTTSTTTPTSTTTTTTPTSTTTPATTTIPPVECGISDIATRSAQVTSSSLFVTPRVVGGRIAGTCTTYPWMVRLTINNGEVCGGAILDETHILTAAHCVINKNKIKATVGDYDSAAIEGTEQTFDINTSTGVSAHEDFSFSDRSNDVAVLTLDNPIDFSQICATPICLDPNYKITSGQSCTVAGWGATSESSRVSSTTLQEASIPTYQGTECSTVFPNAGAGYFTDPDRQLCAGQPSTGGVDACSGDSGGPLMCLDQFTSTWVVAGIVSYGQGCARANNPGVYTNTAAYYRWITQQLTN